MKTKLALAVLLLIPGVGCASIISGTMDEISVESDPPNAKIYVVGQGQVATTTKTSNTTSMTSLPTDARFTQYTPCKLTLSKNARWTIHMTKKGYEEEVFQVPKEMDPNFWFNAFNLFLMWPIDAGNGAKHRASKTEFFVKLKPLGD